MQVSKPAAVRAYTVTSLTAHAQECVCTDTQMNALALKLTEVRARMHVRMHTHTYSRAGALVLKENTQTMHCIARTGLLRESTTSLLDWRILFWVSFHPANICRGFYPRHDVKMIQRN